MLFYERRGNALVARLSGELDHSAATRLRLNPVSRLSRTSTLSAMGTVPLAGFSQFSIFYPLDLPNPLSPSFSPASPRPG